MCIRDSFYKDVKEKRLKKDNGEAKTDIGTIRIYKIRDKFNKGDLLKGRWPKNNNEIAIDRMHADNVKIKLNEKIKVNDKKYKVVGLFSLSDYQCLFEKPTDIMFDAIGFDVGIVKAEEFDKIVGLSLIHI